MIVKGKKKNNGFAGVFVDLFSFSFLRLAARAKYRLDKINI